MSWLTDNPSYIKADEDLRKVLESNVRISTSLWYYLFLTVVFIGFFYLLPGIDIENAGLGYIFGIIVSFISITVHGVNYRNNLVSSMIAYRKVRDEIFKQKEDWYERNCTCSRAPWEEYRERWRY